MYLSSMLHNPILIGIVTAAIVVIASLRVVLPRMGIALPATIASWQFYLRGQGTVLFGFLLAGAALAWGMTQLGDNMGKVTSNVRLIEYRQLTIGQNPSYEDVDLEGYAQMSIYVRSLAPRGSRVTVRVIPGNARSAEQSVTFQATDSSWSHLDQSTSAPRVTLQVGDSHPDPMKSTQVDVLLFLSKPGS